MTRSILTIEASAIYSVTAPTLEVLVNGVVYSSSVVTATTGVGSDLLTFTIDYPGTMPSSLSFRFNDGSAEAGRTLDVENVRINGQLVDRAGDLTSNVSLNQNDSVGIIVANTQYLYGREAITAGDLGTVTQTGTAGDDFIRGTGTDPAVIDAGAGNDRVMGLSSDDAIIGGDGNDYLFGADGNDIMIGGLGNDILSGDAGDDLLHGQDGNDVLIGGAGNDLLNGGLGNDVLAGDVGDDVMFGEDGDDKLIGDAGNDSMYGDAGADMINGGAGDDYIEGGDGADMIVGGAGANEIYGDAGADNILGGGDVDTIDGGAGTDNIFAGAGNDVVSGGTEDDAIFGDAGNDTLNGDAGNDYLNGGAGADTIDGGDGNDIIQGNGLDYFAISSIVNSNAGVVYSFTTGSFYQLVDAGSNITWADAETAAEGTTLSGVSGHLAVITSQVENDYLVANVYNGTDSYIGSSDTTTDGTWQWEYGPEAGVRFWDEGTASALNGMFANWTAGQPDDSNGTQNYGYVLGATNQWGDTSSGSTLTAAQIETMYGVTYNATTGNFYKYVNGNTDFNTANTAAGSVANEVEGVAGHLATITSAAENTFVQGILGGNSWLGGSDSGVEGNWTWITGPENGTQFSTGSTAEPGQYANWSGGQPNDWGGGQDYMVMNSGSGAWSDFAVTDNYDYVIEWEGADIWGGGGSVTISQYVIEWEGGQFSDDSAADILSGGAGNDQIYGWGGDDTLNGDAGDDYLYGGDGNDILDGGADADVVVGGNGDDTITGGAGNDVMYASVAGTVGAETVNASVTGSSLTAAQIETMYGVTYDSATGNFYKYVNGNTDFNTATTAAGSLANEVEGVAGHLATITSAAENTFVQGLLGGDSWLGGSDASVEGSWTWITGPETGTQFSNGSTALPGQYANWSGGQPNDWGGNQDHMVMVSGSGQWSDFTNTSNYDYVIEWEGSDIWGGGGGSSTNNVTLLDENFDTNTGVFTYSDGGFGGTDGPNVSVTGTRITTDGGVANGSLQVYVDGQNNSSFTNGSGSWDTSVTATADLTNVQLTFSYRHYHYGPNDNGEDSQVWVDFNGTTYDASGGNSFVHEWQGVSGNNTDLDAGWVTVTIDLPDLTSGSSYSLSMGILHTGSSRSNEDAYVRFDDITLSGDDGTGSVGVISGSNDATSSGNDSAAANYLDGGDGDDVLYGSAGDDTLYGNAGNDTLYSDSSQTYTVTDALAEISGLQFNDDTGSFYYYVSGAVTATNAFTAADAMTLNGINGHIVHITSATENSYIDSLTGTATTWMGATDSAVEGEWRWVGGKLDGQMFWQGTSSGSLQGGFTYENFNGGEPNDWSGGEDYLEIQNGGGWNDNGAPQQPGLTHGYVVEWEASEVFSFGATELNGGAGADDLYGSGGADLFVFDSNSGDAFTNPDTVHNFDSSDGDALDISDILSGMDVNSTNIANYVEVTEANGVRVDTSGSGTFGAATTIATFDGYTDISDAITMLANGNLLVN